MTVVFMSVVEPMSDKLQLVVTVSRTTLAETRQAEAYRTSARLSTQNQPVLRNPAAMPLIVAASA